VVSSSSTGQGSSPCASAPTNLSGFVAVDPQFQKIGGIAPGLDSGGVQNPSQSVPVGTAGHAAQLGNKISDVDQPIGWGGRDGTAGPVVSGGDSIT
jgi:hypothetical protein